MCYSSDLHFISTITLLLDDAPETLPVLIGSSEASKKNLIIFCII